MSFEYDEKIQTSFFSFGGTERCWVRFIRRTFSKRVKFIGINTGRLGFFNDYNMKRAARNIREI